MPFGQFEKSREQLRSDGYIQRQKFWQDADTQSLVHVGSDIMVKGCGSFQFYSWLFMLVFETITEKAGLEIERLAT